ncbi:MAG: translation initiation factor IF-2 [Anaerohalosphaeraceae bacterium]
MAKAVTRVYLLAKDLGVPSKAIVEKCLAEGMEMKTGHMSPLTAGQAATVREWFSEGSHTTAVETSKPVDLEKIRVKRKKAAVADTVETETEVATQVATEESAVAEAAQPVSSVETMSDEAAATEVPAPVEQASQLVVETPPPAEIVETPAPAPSQEVTAQPAAAAIEESSAAAEAVTEQPETAPQKGFPTPVMHVPVIPKDIKPAGPMLHKPMPVQLSGPTVVRVEAADEDALRPPKKGKAGRETRGHEKEKDKRKPAGSGEKLMIGKAEPPAPVPVGGKPKKGKDKGKKGSDFDEDARSKGGSKRMRAKDVEERQARLAAASGEFSRFRPSRRIETRSAEDQAAQMERPETAAISEPITVKELASALRVKIGDIIGRLMKQGVMATANQALSTDTAELIALEFGTELIVQKKQTILEQIQQQFVQRERNHLQKRPPIVTMLGHVDHGKTSLLDRIRQAEVAKGEAGGITQHIGAYQAELNGKRVTFLDTPGHEAFTALRARGANMTDIVVLVVAADDGVMPQTVEAIRHAKAAGVQIIVALNKIDLPGMDIHRVYGQLAEHELTPSEWGGNTEIVKTSATTGQGIEELIEHLDYIAELKDFKADPELDGTGWIIEAKMTQSQGAVATLLIHEGSIEKGDIVVCGSAYGRIRTLTDSRGRNIKKAGPAMPVEISGLDEVPQAGDRFYKLTDINQAKQAADENKHLMREESLAKRSLITLDNLFSQIEAGNVKELNLIVKADVQGSVEVLQKYLGDLSTPEVRVKILHAAVGGITEGDVVLAEASQAIVIGFNAVPDEHVRQIADSKGVDIRLYSIIYRITEDLRAAMVGMLEPEIQEKTLGRLVVRQTFKVSSIGTIAGCYVTSGQVNRDSKLRLIRNNIVVKDKCSIESLKHVKDDVKEVKMGFECGVKIANFDDIKVDDVLEAYEMIKVARTL